MKGTFPLSAAPNVKLWKRTGQFPFGRAAQRTDSRSRSAANPPPLPSRGASKADSHGQKRGGTRNEPYARQAAHAHQQALAGNHGCGNFVRAEKAKNAFPGPAHRCHTLMQVFRQHNEGNEKQLEAGTKAKGTLLTCKTVYKQLQESLTVRCHVKGMALQEPAPAFISDVEMFPAQANTAVTLRCQRANTDCVNS